MEMNEYIMSLIGKGNVADIEINVSDRRRTEYFEGVVLNENEFLERRSDYHEFILYGFFMISLLILWFWLKR